MGFDHGSAFMAFDKAVRCLNQRFKDKFFIVDGTLLGCVRSDDFIHNDYDIDFGMWIEDYEPFDSG